MRLLIASAILTHCGSAALPSISDHPASPGQLLASSVTLSSEGTHLSALQFDLQWEEGLDLQVATGSAGRDAGKLVYSTPLTAHGLRIVIVGMNLTDIADGELLRLFIVVNSTLSTQIVSREIKMTNALGVTGSGAAVSIRVPKATVAVDSTASGLALVPESVLNAASLLSGAIAPGEIVTLLGAFGIDANSSASVTANVDRVPATVLYALGNQVNALVPFGTDPVKPADLELRSSNRQLARITLPTKAAVPALFTASGTGIGPGAILNESYSVNAPERPALRGSIVMMYGTGFGALSPAAVDGQTGGFSATAVPVIARIGGVKAEVIYAGSAPGLAPGLTQINVRIPNDVVPGDALAVSLTVGSVSIPEGVTVAVR